VTYDVIPGESIIVDRPDILIIEGLNVLLPNRPARDGRAIPFVSDFFDFSVYLHATEKDLEKWFISRFMRLRDTSFRDPQSYFKKYAGLDDPRRKRPRAPFGQNQSSQSARKHPSDDAPRSLVLTKGQATSSRKSSYGSFRWLRPELQSA
jgi:type I pantothenate kinase